MLPCAEENAKFEETKLQFFAQLSLTDAFTNFNVIRILANKNSIIAFILTQFHKTKTVINKCVLR